MASKLEQKFRYIWMDEDGEFRVTNDEDLAQTASEDQIVVDVVTGKTLDGDEVLEAKAASDDDSDG